MKLYYSSGACGISPNITLNEAGMDFDMIAVDLQTKKTEHGDDFLQVNKKGCIPVLEISEGVTLTEGPAILQYIADQVPEKNLAPKNGTMDRYRLQERLNFITSELHKGFPVFFYPDYADNKDAQAAARTHLRTRFSYINNVLGKQDYLMGDTFSVADGYLYNVTRWTTYAEIDVEKEFPNIYAFMERVEARPAVQKTLKSEKVCAFTSNKACAA